MMKTAAGQEALKPHRALSVNTVFVVGAGAHKDYGMPTGAELKDALLSGRKATNNPAAWSVEVAADEFMGWISTVPDCDTLPPIDRSTLIAEYCRVLNKLVCHESIDKFVASDKSFGPTALRLMKSALGHLECACVRNLINGHQVHGFNQWVLDRLTLRDPASGGNSSWFCPANSVSIITFNYDRLLEIHAAARAWKANDSTLEIPVLASPDVGALGIPVHHVYGQLTRGYTLHRNGRLAPTEPPGHMVPIDTKVHTAPHQPREEAWQNPPSLWASSKIGSTLRRADRIVFVGFGFDETNMHVLQNAYTGERPTRKVEALATAYGASPQRRLEIKRAIEDLLGDALTDPVRFSSPHLAAAEAVMKLEIA